MNAPRIEESELHAFVDGELDAETRRRVEEHLHKSPEDAALVEGWRRQNAALRAAFATTAKEPLPVSLRRTRADAGASFGSGVNWARFSPSKATSLRTLRRSDTSRRIPRRPAIAVSIATLLVGAIIAGAALLAFTGPAAPPDRMARLVSTPSYVARAFVAFGTFAQDSRPVEIGADRRDELAAWLAERTGFAALPDLGPAGLELVGGRLVPGVAAPAGFLLYETKSGARAGLYFERADRDSPPQEPPRTALGVAAVEWRAAGSAFVLIGPLSAEALRAAAERAAGETRR